MLRTTAVAWAIAALATIAPAVATAGAKTRGSDAGACPGAYVIAKDAASLAKASAAVLCLVNTERTARGLGAMRGSGQLATAATGHSADMIANKVLTHTGSDGTEVQQRVSRAGYRWTAVAETIAWGAARRSTPYLLVSQLMRSNIHRSILLDRMYRDLGVGLALGSPARRAAGASSTLTLVFARS